MEKDLKLIKKGYNDRYIAKNKDKILAKGREKKVCPICHALVSASNMSHHQKTIKCESAKAFDDIIFIENAKQVEETFEQFIRSEIERLTRENSEMKELIKQKENCKYECL